ncbi:MAG: hypothetical protein QM775_27215 [Pirellulales bacterium]
MRTFTTFLTAVLMLAAASAASARDYPWGRPGFSYANTAARPAVTHFYRAPATVAPLVATAPALAAAPQATTGTRSLSVEPGPAPVARPFAAPAPANRVVPMRTPAWLLPRDQRYNTR